MISVLFFIKVWTAQVCPLQWVKTATEATTSYSTEVVYSSYKLLWPLFSWETCFDIRSKHAIVVREIVLPCFLVHVLQSSQVFKCFSSIAVLFCLQYIVYSKTQYTQFSPNFIPTIYYYLLNVHVIHIIILFT